MIGEEEVTTERIESIPRGRYFFVIKYQYGAARPRRI